MSDKGDDKADKNKCTTIRGSAIAVDKYNYNYNDNNDNVECHKMSVLIKHLEKNWTIKKNVNYNDKTLDKNKKEKEYILKKSTGRRVKIKLIRFEEYLKEDEVELSNEKCENKHKSNINFSDGCLRNFIYNALENEWKLKKIGNKYFCSKKHKGDKHVYQAGYLKDFLLDNFTLE
jgi:hypothetical protein